MTTPLLTDGDHTMVWQLPALEWNAPYVYVAWSRHDPEEVLYVGLTEHPLMRMAQHSRSSPWWGDAEHIDFYRHRSREDAKRSEGELINAYDPIHNIAGRYWQTTRWTRSGRQG